MRQKRMFLLIVLCIIMLVVFGGVVSKVFNNKDSSSFNDESLSQSESEADDVKAVGWKKIYMSFIKEERKQPSFTLTDFTYAFVDCYSFEYPLLVLKDQWNLYLFYLQQGKVCAARDESGDILALSRMDTAYIKEGELFVQGSCGVPKEDYFGKVEYDNAFRVKYIAEKTEMQDGSFFYHDDQGNELTKDQYIERIESCLINSEKILFTK